MRTNRRPDNIPFPASPVAIGDATSLAVPTSVDRLALRLDDIAKALGISRRAVERERSAGRLPRPDRTVGRVPLWRVQTIDAWLAGGGR